jgi:hypothetical protein
MTTPPFPHGRALCLYNVPKQEVLDCNVQPFIERMTPYVLNPEPDLVDTFAVLIDGYNDVDDEIYTIPEIRAYWQELDRRWPYIFFFGSVLAEMPQMVAWCCHNNLNSYKRPGCLSTMIDYDKPELIHWLHQHWPPMNCLFELAYPDPAQREYAIFERTRQIFRAFNIEFP